MKNAAAAGHLANITAGGARKNGLLQRMWRYKELLLMLLPGLAWFVVYKYFPIYGALIAFKDYDILKGITNSPWANPWYKHIKFFIDSPYFSQLIGNTLLISVYRLAFGMLPPIVLAILFNECRVGWLKRFSQTVTYMPHFLSWVIVYGILVALLSQSTGLVNRWIVDSGHSSVPFLSSNDWFRTILISSDIWQGAGWGAIIYLAGIAAIDPTLYEAARVDGAGRFRQIWHITLPGIRSVIVLLFILRLGHIMDAGFDQIFVMYNINVYQVADIIDTWVYRSGLEQLNFSLSSAVGLFKSFIGLALVLVANRLAKRWGGGIW
ncbi:ABC transporter permease [Paenibacillus cymbidii]|uniref:ABC transporter permease n=1 Tax=Paenibacillus cymbidii TaxID=1639034 RepID=UPI00108120FE